MRLALAACALTACRFQPSPGQGGPLDASTPDTEAVDTAEVDGVADAPVDALPDAPRADARVGLPCDLDGVCDPAETESGCPADCCTQSCSSGCDTCCRTELIDAVCSATGTCLCYQHCVGEAATCTNDCSGGSTCYVDCRSSTSCLPNCTGGSPCTVDCRGVSGACHVDCASSDCLLFCAGAADCVFTQCSGGSRDVTDCGSGVFVCNADGACP